MRRPLGDDTAAAERVCATIAGPLIVATVRDEPASISAAPCSTHSRSVLLSLMLAPVVRWLGRRIGPVPAVLL